MDHANAPARRFFGVLVGAAVLTAGSALPSSAPQAMEAEGAGLFSPAMGCEPAESRMDAALLARVRSNATAERRRESATKARPRGDSNGGARQAGRPSAPRSARKAPTRASEEPQTALIRSFYTCNPTRSPALTEGTGWRLVGPLRQG